MSEIVVGVDDAVASERALDVALRLAELTGDRLRLVHAWTPSLYLPAALAAGAGAPCTDVVALREQDEQEAAHLLDTVLAKGLARRTSEHPVRVRGEVREGRAGRVLADLSRSADLLVVGADRRGALASAVLGSTTGYVLHSACCPVVLVPADAPPPGPVRRVVVGVDGSRGARAALLWGLAAAAREHCPLVALHAWTSDAPETAAATHAFVHAEQYEADARAWLADELAEVLPAGHGVEVRAEVAHSTAAWALITQAGPDDLLVVGSRGRSGLPRLLLGSVATQCAQHAHGVTVVVRPRA